MTHRTKHAGMIIAGVVGGAALAVATGNEQPVSATYQNPWSRTDAYNLGITGLMEAYEFGHSKWNNNDVQEAWPTEGADCSGYAGKVWAAPAYTDIGTDYSYPDTGTWYSAGVDGSVLIAVNDARTRQMDTWVTRVSAGGSSNHMAVFQGSYNSSYGWKYWNAASEAIGIKDGYHFDSWFTAQNARRFKRANW
jgi:hypothetical protein